MELGLKDKVVLVTGASRGLGAAIAVAFGGEGSKLILVARTEIELNRVAAAAQQQGASDVLAIAADLTQTHEIERLVSQAIDRFETIHVLVNNIKLKRSGIPTEVAAAVVFLASEAASFIVGTNLRVDGGSVASI